MDKCRITTEWMEGKLKGVQIKTVVTRLLPISLKPWERLYRYPIKLKIYWEISFDFFTSPPSPNHSIGPKGSWYAVGKIPGKGL